MLEAVLRWIESNPDPVYYPVHYGDTGQFCQCERCKAWYELERWIAMHPLGAQGIITFEYPTTYYYVGYPYPALYAFAENLKYYRRLGIRGVYICGLTDGHLVHLYSYVMPRLMWNPDASLRS